MSLLIKRSSFYSSLHQFSRNYLSFISSKNIFSNIQLINQRNCSINYAILNKTQNEDLQHQQQGYPVWQMKCAVNNAINEKLNNYQYSNAFNVWKLFVENTQSTFGILFLIEFLFKNCEGNELKRNIVLLWNESKTLLTPNEFIAYLIIGMMKTGYIEEANIFAKKFTIFGTSFITPFKEAIEGQEDCLEFFKQFSQFLENNFFSVPALTKELKVRMKAKRDEKYKRNFEKLEEGNLKEEKEEKEEEVEEEIIEEVKKPKFRFQNLIWIWSPPKKFKNPLKDDLPRLNKPKKQKIHQVNFKSLEKFCLIFVELWYEKAVLDLNVNSGISSLECCYSFVKRNGLSLPNTTFDGNVINKDLNNNKINNKSTFVFKN